MKFLSLQAENFMRLKSVELPLDNQGLVLILGDNRDAPNAKSNGAGKSSFLDALCWALWGKTIRGLSGDDVVNRTVRKNCRVSVTWEDAGSVYTVTRYRKMEGRKKPNDVELVVDGVAQDGNAMSATDERIEARIGLSFEAFQAMMPGAGVKLANLTDTEIKKLLEQMLQMDVIATAQQLAKEDLKLIEAQLALKMNSLSSLQGVIDMNKLALTSYHKGLSQFEDDRESDIFAIQEEIGVILHDMEVCTKEMKAAEKAEELLGVLKTKIDSKSQDVLILQRDLNNKRTNFNDLITQVKLKTARLQEQLKQRKNEYKRVETLGTTCKTCDQDISADYRQERLNEIQASISDIVSQIASEQASEAQLQQTCTDELNKIKLTVDVLSKDLDILNTQHREAANVVATGKLAEDRNKKLWIRHDTLAKKQHEIQARVSPFEKLIEDTTTTLTKTQAELDKLEKSTNDLRERVKMLTFWVSGFSTKGLRSLMLKHVVPILNARVKYYADMLTAGEMTIEFSTKKQFKNGKSSDEFSVVVLNEHGSGSYTGASTGERGRADLAIAFAIGDLAHLRAKKRIPFRFLDEPFEHIDEAGHESILNLLAEQKDTYDTVYCITHNKAFQRMFPKCITVVKENGVSRLEL